MTKEQECMKALQCLYLEVPSVIADDVKQKVIDALNEVKNCAIPDVSKRSEQLIAFFDWLNKQGNITNMYTDKYMYIEMYLKSN